MKTKECKQIVKRLMKERLYQRMTFDQLAEFMDLTKKKDRQMLTHVLKELNLKTNDGKDRKKTEKDRPAPEKVNNFNNNKNNNRTKIADDTPKIEGVLRGNQRGFGFVIPDYSIFSEDIFIHEKNLYGALDMDKVSVRIISEPGDKRPEGEVVEIIERGHKKIIGRYEKGKGFGFVVPDNDRICKDIFVPDRRGIKAFTGDKVVTEILVWSDRGKNPEGEIVEILGNEAEPGIDILSVLKEYDIPMDFSAAVEQAAEQLSDKISEQELEKRKDLRNEIIFTIDGDDAKDFDDAVSIRQNDNGNFVLGVHIADVSHYVKQGDAIDESALERGTSVYVIDRVVPMLPFKLSNDVCSLVPDKDRLTFSCEMEIDTKGCVKDYSIYKSVIRSKSRMTYRLVADLLAGTGEQPNRLEPFREKLALMDELHEILRVKRRLNRGAINFDFPEAKITLDKKGFPIRLPLMNDWSPIGSLKNLCWSATKPLPNMFPNWRHRLFSEIIRNPILKN